MKFFVPGGLGYIGTVFCNQILQLGHEVLCVDNLMFRQRSFFHLLNQPNFSFIEGDFCDQALMRDCLKSADVVIPLAALVGAPLCDRFPERSLQVNYEAPLSFFKLLSPQQVLIMPTTNSAYGKGGEGNYCDESSPLNPISTYAKMKVEIESKLLEHPQSISFRLATVFGVSPRMRLDLLVNDFVYRAFTQKKLVLFEAHFKRNYIHIQDVCRAFLFGLENINTMKQQIFNVGLSEANLTKRQLADEIQKQIIDLTIEENDYAKDPDQRDYLVSNAKIEALGFKPKMNLQAGISELLRACSYFDPEVSRNV